MSEPHPIASTWGSLFIFELSSRHSCHTLAPISDHVVGMHRSKTQLTRAVQDELEQALHSLPRVNADNERVALLIEEAIEIAIEMELSEPTFGRRIRREPTLRS